jgi:hypothetical protein
VKSYLRFTFPVIFVCTCAHVGITYKKKIIFSDEDNTGPAHTHSLGELGHPDRSWSRHFKEKYETRVRLEIGEWRIHCIEARRVGPKREFWTPRVLSSKGLSKV